MRTASTPLRIAAAMLVPATVLAALWLLFTGARVDALVIGVPCVVLAVLALRAAGGGTPVRLRIGPALLLVPRFLAQSVHGAVLVTLRAFGVRSLPSPRCVPWPSKLRHGRGRLLFMNMVSLVPGTLSVRDEGEVLMVHVLDGTVSPDKDLAELEGRVARVHGRSAGRGSDG